ncbi:MAG TPA: hypothetical protein VFG89_09680, partial [Coriobacteriia bacterium]|nr:hypothetical protein [Coriobacteriia bacterium]
MRRTLAFLLVCALALAVAGPVYAGPSDDAYPGVAAPSYDFTNSLDSDTDQVDIWSAPFNKGDQIELTITADDGQDIICEIHGPG